MSEWITPQPSPVPDDFQSLIGGHPLIAQALARRGFPSAEAARAFLDPGEYQPTPAEELPGIELAGERLERAIAARLGLPVSEVVVARDLLPALPRVLPRAAGERGLAAGDGRISSPPQYTAPRRRRTTTTSARPETSRRALQFAPASAPATE